MKKCQLCDQPKGKGRLYITTSLVSKTTRLEGLSLCKEHSDEVEAKIWNVVFKFMRGEAEE